MDINAINKTLPYEDQIVTRRILAEELAIFGESMNEKFDFLLETIEEKFEVLTGVMVEKIHDMSKANMEGVNMRLEAHDRQLKELQEMNRKMDIRMHRLEVKSY